MNFIKNDPDKYMVSFSTNDLKNEWYDRMKSQIDVVKSPSLYEIRDKLPRHVWKRINSFYRSGKHISVLNYIKELFVNSRKLLEEGKIDTRSLVLLNNYRIELQSFHFSKSHAFTTHARLMTMSPSTLRKYKVVFIDEDIILNCLIPNQVEILIREFKEILSHIDPDCELAIKITAALDAAKKAKWFSLLKIEYMEVYDGIPTLIDIPSFCMAERFYSKSKDDENNLLESNRPDDGIIFIRPFELTKGVKYIVTSATANHGMYNLVFGANRIKFYECKDIKYKGTVYQCAEYTMSRADIAHKPGILDILSTLTGNELRFTFKRFIRKPDDPYICKTTGINAYEGMSYDIMATPHHPEFVYKLIAYTFDFLETAKFFIHAKMRYQQVAYNGKSFWFMTYDKDVPMLRDIQFWMIGSELEQTVGRARSVHHDCVVNVFSNFPVDQSVPMKIKIDRDEIEREMLHGYVQLKPHGQ
jgi:hypothetical protein